MLGNHRTQLQCMPWEFCYSLRRGESSSALGAAFSPVPMNPRDRLEAEWTCEDALAHKVKVSRP